MAFFKSNFFFIFVGIILLFVIIRLFSGSGSSSYDYGYAGDHNSSGVTVRDGKVDLSGSLDPKSLPLIVEKLFKEGAKQKKKEEELVQFVMHGLQQEIKQNSTIDLNNDSITDPIFVVPSGTPDEEITFSVRVPDWDQVGTLPEGSGEDYVNKMNDIAMNKYIEVVSINVIPKSINGNLDGFEVQSSPNKHLYEHSSPYYRHSFSDAMFSYLMIRTLFGPPLWWGPSYYWRYGGMYGGYYHGGYRYSTVSTVTRTRSNYNTSNVKGSSAAMKSSSGKSLASKSASTSAPKSVQNFKSTAVQARASSASNRATGFGSSSSKSSSGSRSFSSSGGSRSSGK